jgi:hypothetical protein
MRRLKISCNFVLAWTKSDGQDCETDKRGWKEGSLRTHSEEQRELVVEARKYLTKAPNEFYVGADAVSQRLTETADDPTILKTINRSFINRILKHAELLHITKKRVKHGSRYQHYPERLLTRLGQYILEADFLERYLTDQSEPVNFVGMSVKTLKLRQFQRIGGQTNQELINSLNWFEKNFFTPEAVKLDNAASNTGSLYYQRTLGNVILHLLSHKIIPVFTAPRKPWNNGSVEGSNSVFGRNFWQPNIFTSVDDIDLKLTFFNLSSLKHSLYESKCKPTVKNEKFVPRIYYIRKVEAIASGRQGCFSVANTTLFIHKKYINLFVLAEWNLKTENLIVLFETETGQAQRIYQQKFLIHPKSKLVFKSVLISSET